MPPTVVPANGGFYFLRVGFPFPHIRSQLSCASGKEVGARFLRIRAICLDCAPSGGLMGASWSASSATKKAVLQLEVPRFPLVPRVGLPWPSPLTMPQSQKSADDATGAVLAFTCSFSSLLLDTRRAVGIKSKACRPDKNWPRKKVRVQPTGHRRVRMIAPCLGSGCGTIAGTSW